MTETCTGGTCGSQRLNIEKPEQLDRFFGVSTHKGPADEHQTATAILVMQKLAQGSEPDQAAARKIFNNTSLAAYETWVSKDPTTVIAIGRTMPALKGDPASDNSILATLTQMKRTTALVENKPVSYDRNNLTMLLLRNKSLPAAVTPEA